MSGSNCTGQCRAKRFQKLAVLLVDVAIITSEAAYKSIGLVHCVNIISRKVPTEIVLTKNAQTTFFKGLKQ